MSRAGRLLCLSTVVFGGLAVLACSGSDDAVTDVSPTTPAGGDADRGSDRSPPPPSATAPASPGTSSGNPPPASAPDAGGEATGGNCVPKGHPGNEKKIGAYCDKDTACPFQLDPFLVCTAPYDPTGTHSFCTAPCSKDVECGSGAKCVHDAQGSGCVPDQCGDEP